MTFVPIFIGDFELKLNLDENKLIFLPLMKSSFEELLEFFLLNNKKCFIYTYESFENNIICKKSIDCTHIFCESNILLTFNYNDAIRKFISIFQNDKEIHLIILDFHKSKLFFTIEDQ